MHADSKHCGQVVALDTGRYQEHTFSLSTPFLKHFGRDFKSDWNMTIDVICQDRKSYHPSSLLFLDKFRKFRSSFHPLCGTNYPWIKGNNPSRGHFSLLLSLPYEIREKIFLYVIARHPIVHIIRQKGPPRRLRAVCCQDADPHGKPLSQHHCWSEHLLFINHWQFPHIHGDPKADGKATGDANLGFIGLLLTCREM